MKALIGFFLFWSLLAAEEKPPAFEEEAKRVNSELMLLKKELKEQYEKAPLLYREKDGEKELFKLKERIRSLKEQKRHLEADFRAFLVGSASIEEAYAFWDQGETTLGQLVMEYGSSDFLYIIPSEIASLKMNMYSALALPHESFEEMIELILSQNGIGIKKLTPALRQLFVLRQDPGFIEYIVSSLEELKLVPETGLVFYLFSPQAEELRPALGFFEKFSDPKEVGVQAVGAKIALTALKKNVERLITLYEAAFGKSKGKNYQVYNLRRLKAEEGEKIVRALFADNALNRNRPPFFGARVDELVIIPLVEKNALVFLGDDAQVKRAFELLSRLEEGVLGSEELELFWYTCRHSDPEEIARLLGQLLGQMAKEGVNFENGKPEELEKKENLAVGQEFVEPGKIEKKNPANLPGGIVVDAKSSSLLMVLKKETIKTIEAVLKKIDVPKKMAQIEVLLVERRLQDHKQSGINLLKIGSGALERKTISFDSSEKAENRGILEFLYSHHTGHLPGIDLALNFLMAQEDLRINANPSILAINQTPAKISIVEELSINTGMVRLGGAKDAALEQSYTRAQYGTTIVLTPTIHLPENSGEVGYITLQTNVEFDTHQQDSKERPSVTRRHIENEVCIADGETIILGGLRRKAEKDRREKIPFLGDLPGLGKLFGSTDLTDDSTEMFIFITPKIIYDPQDGLKEQREKSLQKRPGDTPEFLSKLEEAKKKAKKKRFEDSLQVVFEKF
ncbi:MAG: hypothetical protein WC371_02270 [Parachlamydiales bacterium]|jgi:general secretion pathway protein D